MSPFSSSSTAGFVFLSTMLLLSLLVAPAATELCRPEEKKVLLKMKKAFQNAAAIDRSWSQHTDCCDGWYGITCDPSSKHHVIGLTFMNGNDFSGPIPDAVGDLPYLTAINIHNVSKLTGSIPFSITKLKKLTILEIVRSNLTGTIPGFLSKLKNLVILNLSYNKLTGPIPISLSDIPVLGYVTLSHNRLTGAIPESLVKQNEYGVYLFLSHNKLSGKIPSSFRDIKFTTIDFSYNKLSGNISMLFAWSMNLARNNLAFNMSEMQLYPGLAELDISHNKIYGSLPKKMIHIQWVSLNVSYNSLCGPIPQGGYLQTHFDQTSFFHNRCLCGAPLPLACK